MSDEPISKLIDSMTIGDVRLTLGSWKPHPEYPASFEIGYRDEGDFFLIQFSMQKEKAWSVVSRLVRKGRSVKQIRRVIERLESR